MKKIAYILFFSYLCSLNNYESYEMRRFIIIVCVLCACATCVWGVPATPEPIVRVLPDGSTDTVYLHGDENGSFLSRTRIAPMPDALRRAPQRKMRDAYVPSEGQVRIPVILVNFTDLSFTMTDPKAQFLDLFNGNGGSNPNATGSVHTYFDASSNGQLNLTYDVYGPYTLSHDMAYYGSNKTNSSGVVTSHNQRASDLVIEAVNLANNNGVDFSLYDANNDMLIDNVSIIVAGYNEAEGGREETIWPHYSVIPNSSRYDNKYISGYLMISEYRGSGGQVQAGIGTYCHEFGHALGLPDLYDTKQDRYTVGTWDVMCSGCYNNSGSTPPTYTAFERFMMGWLTPRQVTAPGMQTLPPIETSNEAILIAAEQHNLQSETPTPREYFLLENRQAVGWDAGKNALVSTGLLVSHVTFSSYDWNYNTFNNNTPLGYAIVSAGMTQPTHSTAADVFPGSTKRTTWLPTLNDGTTLDEYLISQIRQRADSDMSFFVGETGEDMLRFRPDEIDAATTYLNQPVAYDTAHAVLHIPAMAYDSLLLYMQSRLFRYSADSGKTWYANADSAWVPIHRDSTYDMPLWVVHTPTKESCSYTYAYLSAETPDQNLGTQATLRGISPRPVLITTPVVDSVADITSHTMSIFWQPVSDADGYYYTLYSLSEGTGQDTEDFENFSTLAQIRDKGWDANFLNSQATISQAGHAVLFKQSGEYLQTPRYMLTPHQLSVWLSNSYTTGSYGETVGGQLRITGTADGLTWDNVATIVMQRVTKNVTRTFDLDTARHWRQFRITYDHTGGEGGAIIDTWSAHYPVQVNYIEKLGDHILYRDGNTIVFRELEPNTTYYYAMQAYENKGCEMHYSELSAPLAVRTTPEKDGTPLVVSRLAAGQYRVTLPELADGFHRLALYDYTGHLVFSRVPAYGTVTVDLPTLRVGEVYMLKYYTDKMKRKDINAKILAY